MKKQNTTVRLGCARLAVIGWALCISACSTEASLQRLLGTSASAVVFYGCKTPAEGEARFLFSREVKVTSLYLDPPMETEIVGEGEAVTVRFASGADMPGGTLVSADILVEDKARNTLNVLVSFRTRNERMPDLVVNEIRTVYSGEKPTVEFIELKALNAGNLGALRLFAAYEKKEPIFEFPPVEVKKGDYIVVHTRSIEPGIVDEVGGSRSESKGNDALSGAWDFWMPGAFKLHSTNAVYTMDQDGKIIDGVVLVSGKVKWKETVASAAAEMETQGMWTGSGPEHAVSSDGTTATRTVCRNESRQNSHSAADWYVTATSGATPGRANNLGRRK